MGGRPGRQKTGEELRAPPLQHAGDGGVRLREDDLRLLLAQVPEPVQVDVGDEQTGVGTTGEQTLGTGDGAHTQLVGGADVRPAGDPAGHAAGLQLVPGMLDADHDVVVGRKRRYDRVVAPTWPSSSAPWASSRS
jgi:hypothetical protein